MTVKEILTPVILEEFKKYERSGYKIKLQTAENKRTAYIVWAIVSFVLCCPIISIICLVLMNKIDNVKIILSIAKKYPNMPISQIVAKEMRQ